MTVCFESLPLVNVRDMLRCDASLGLEAGESDKAGRFGQKINFLTSLLWRAIETRRPGNLFAAVDMPCIEHAHLK